jgi:hypothetical protein
MKNAHVHYTNTLTHTYFRDKKINSCAWLEAWKNSVSVSVCVCCMCMCMHVFKIPCVRAVCVCVCVCMEPDDCQFDHQIPSVRWRWIMPLWGIEGSYLTCHVEFVCVCVCVCVHMYDLVHKDTEVFVCVYVYVCFCVRLCIHSRMFV